MKRSAFIALVGLGVLGASPNNSVRIVTYRDRGCGCCEGWIAAARDANYVVELRDVEHADRLRMFAIPESLASCHTSKIAGYLVEGHVPMRAVAKLLVEKPPTRGIALPGMPSGSPGMPGPKQRLRVVLLDRPEHIYYSE